MVTVEKKLKPTKDGFFDAVKKVDRVPALGAQNIDTYELPNGHVKTEVMENVQEIKPLSTSDNDLLACMTPDAIRGTTEYELNLAITKYIESNNRDAALPEFVYRVGCLRSNAVASDAVEAVISKIG